LGTLPPFFLGGLIRNSLTRRAYVGDTFNCAATCAVFFASSYDVSTRSRRSVEWVILRSFSRQRYGRMKML
jgi:hypothetical protein